MVRVMVRFGGVFRVFSEPLVYGFTTSKIKALNVKFEDKKSQLIVEEAGLIIDNRL